MRNKKVMRNKKALTNKEWGEIYNLDTAVRTAKDLMEHRLSAQTQEMLKLTEAGCKTLEIGCGSGMTSVYLQMNNRFATALDFSEEALACTREVARCCGVEINTVFADATKELPFKDNAFDVIFQAGLLEHFYKEQRIKLLKQWGRVGKTMISMIPNAASIAYRTGKNIMEKNGTWVYGLELPQYSLQGEFYEAGFKVIDEYTIGAERALNLLPLGHWLRDALDRWIKENDCEDCCGQGYLLVTVGENMSCQ